MARASGEPDPNAIRVIDPVTLRLLPAGQVLGVLPQREPGMLQRLGVTADPAYGPLDPEQAAP